MADLPIPFSGPMVRALLAGTKTQTRRTIEPYEMALHPFRGNKPALKNLIKIKLPARLGGFVAGPTFNPRYAIGDRLYVREHWRAEARLDKKAPRDIKTNYPGVKYIATDDPDDFGIEGKFRQGMHMPRWASRLTLIVTDVRVERLQDISEADAKAEGVPEYLEGNTTDEPYCETCSGMGVHGAFGQDYGVTEVDCQECVTAKQKYQSLWNHINGSGAWDANPWVVAYTFKVIKANIDQIGGAE